MEEQPDACSICLDEMVPHHTCVLPCGHRFHTSCIVMYARYRQNIHLVPMCPLCNTVFQIRLQDAPVYITSNPPWSRSNIVVTLFFVMVIVAVIIFMLVRA